MIEQKGGLKHIIVSWNHETNQILEAQMPTDFEMRFGISGTIP